MTYGSRIGHRSATITAADDAERFRVVFSWLPPIGRAGDEARELAKKAGCPALDGGLRRYVAHGRAAAAGVLVRDAGGDHAADGWKDALELAREILR
jgi:chromosome partitioning protein